MPDWKKVVRERLSLPDLKDLREQRIFDEISGQLEEFYEEARGQGLSDAEARGQAVDRFDWDVLADGLARSEKPWRRSPLDALPEKIESGFRKRGGWWIRFADTLGDLRFALRQMRRSPGVTVAALLCMGIAMGGGAVLYGMAVITLLRPSPATDPDRVVRVYTRWEGSEPHGSVSYPDFEDLRREVDAFECAAINTPMPMSIAIEGRSRRSYGALVSASYFRCLGVEMALGRSFRPEEDEGEGAHPVVVLSYAVWKSRLAGDPDVIGRQIRINRHPFTIIGVAEESFYGDSVGLVMTLWVPVAMHEVVGPLMAGISRRDDHNFRSVICRLRPGATYDQAVAQVSALCERLADQHPETFRGKSLVVLPERQASLDPTVRGDFQRFIVFGFVVLGIVLLLACANVAGLLLARTAGRQREIGIRMALGASRGRLMQSLLIESATLAVAAGILACGIAALLNRAIGGIGVPMDIPLSISEGGGVSWKEILFVIVASGIAAMLVGLTPAIQASREEIVSALKSGYGSLPRRAAISRRVLVMVQVAASLTLLVGGGLVLKGMRHMQQIDPGFDPANQMTTRVDLILESYTEAEGRRFYRELKERLSSLPGVVAVGMAFNLPLSLSAQSHAIEVDGYEHPEDQRLIVDVNTADEGYFAAMGIPILEGRSFSILDDGDRPHVVIVNEAFRDRFWPGESPVGKRVKHADIWYEVVGMVTTGKYLGLGEAPRPYLYYAFEQNYAGMMNLHFRTATDALASAEALRAEIAGLDPTLPVGRIGLMSGITSFALMPYQIATGVMWTFGLIAVLLASIGLYGLMAYFVNRQVQEIGVRVALGAKRRDVVGQVVGRGMRLTIVGLGIGLLLSLAISVLTSSVMPGVAPFEPLLLALPLMLLVLVAFLASLLPALRAARIAPLDALRAE